MRFANFTVAISAMLAVGFAAPAPPKNDPNLKLWDGPADVWFAAETPTNVVYKAAWAVWEYGSLLEYHNTVENNGHDKGFKALLSNAAIHAMELATGPDVRVGLVWQNAPQGNYCPEVIPGDQCPSRA